MTLDVILQKGYEVSLSDIDLYTFEKKLFKSNKYVQLITTTIKNR